MSTAFSMTPFSFFIIYVEWSLISISGHAIFKKSNTLKTGSTGTVHTSAKARLTSVAISVPPSGESVRDRHQNLTFCWLDHWQPSFQISCKVTNRQRGRQTDKERRKHNLLGGGNNATFCHTTVTNCTVLEVLKWPWSFVTLNLWIKTRLCLVNRLKRRQSCYRLVTRCHGCRIYWLHYRWPRVTVLQTNALRQARC